MEISVHHPTDRPNFCSVRIGGLVIWFSYETPIAFSAPGERGWVVRENDWGPTTGKHLNYVQSPDYAPRVSGEEFEARLGAVIKAMGLASV